MDLLNSISSCKLETRKSAKTGQPYTILVTVFQTPDGREYKKEDFLKSEQLFILQGFATED